MYCVSGLGDGVVLVKGLYKLADLLQGQAVNDFKRFEGFHRDLKSLSKSINQFFDSPQHRTLFRKEIKSIRRLLREFFSCIKELRPYLGRHRDGNAFLRCIKKVTWPLHSEKLERLRKDLLFQVDIITKYQQFSLRDELRGPSDTFKLEDPCGMVHTFDLFHISAWELLHEGLLDKLSHKSTALEMVRNHQYLIHKCDPYLKLLTQSWGIEPIREVIKPGEYLRMSVIFPFKERYEKSCPKCGHHWPAELYEETVTCQNCGLWLYFTHSKDAEPDALTQLALRNVKSCKIAEFVTYYLEYDDPERAITHLEKWVCNIIDESPDSAFKLSEAKRPRIEDICRITVCTPVWPDLSQHQASQNASHFINEVTEGLEHTSNYLDSKDLPEMEAAKFISSRMSGTLEEYSIPKFTKAAAKASNSRIPLTLFSNSTHERIRDVAVMAERNRLSFSPEYLDFRCLLWMYLEILQLEAAILHNSAKNLRSFVTSREMVPQQHTLAEKVMHLPLTLLFSPICVGFELSTLLAEQLKKKPPLYLPKAIQHLVENCGNVSAHYYLYGGLSTYFESVEVLDRSFTEMHRIECLRWFEEAMRSSGTIVYSNLSRRGLYDAVKRGYA